MTKTKKEAHTVLCDYCGISFKRVPSLVRTLNFCSREHFVLYQTRKRVICECATCGAKISVTPSRVKQQENLYCSTKCSLEARTMEKHKDRFLWKQKKVDEDIIIKEDIIVLTPSRRVNSCYHKEARAMLKGLHWRGKNKCTKLVGDRSNIFLYQQ